MQLEELQQQWQRLDEKFEQTLALERQVLRQTVLPPARRRIKRLAIWPALDIAFCLGVFSLTGPFLSHHWKTWLLVIPASVVVTGATVLLIASVRQLALIASIDWTGTVADIQSSLSRLRMAKIWQFKWIILLSPLVGSCVLIVGSQSLLDRLPEPHFILEKLDSSWVVANLAFGVLCVPVGYAFACYLAKRFRGHAWWQRALDDISGISFKRATEELDRWTSLDAGASHAT